MLLEGRGLNQGQAAAGPGWRLHLGAAGLRRQTPGNEAHLLASVPLVNGSSSTEDLGPVNRNQA